MFLPWGRRCYSERLYGWLLTPGTGTQFMPTFIEGIWAGYLGRLGNAVEGKRGCIGHGLLDWVTWCRRPSRPPWNYHNANAYFFGSSFSGTDMDFDGASLKKAK